MSVDGHMSTNDTVLLVANGAAGGKPLAGDDLAAFRTTLDEVCIDLAKAIAGDGEGSTHLVTIEISGCADRASALAIAKTVANSPLVKTAIHGADPNWGRIVSAAGYAERAVRPQGRDAALERLPALSRRARRWRSTPRPCRQSIRDNRDTLIQLDFSEGSTGLRLLDRRPDGRVRAAQRRLSYVSVCRVSKISPLPLGEGQGVDR